MSDENYLAVVQKVFPDGQHGPYAKATSETLGEAITFSLQAPVWKEKRFPDEGTYVILSEITRKRAGWRADSGRFLRPSDEQPVISTQRTTEKRGKR